MSDSPTDCDQFSAGSSLRAICDGTANLPLAKINAYRRRWGLGPLDGPATEPRPTKAARRRPKRSVVRPAPSRTTRPPKPRRRSERSGCCGGGSRRKARSPRPNGWGPGSQLLELLGADGLPHCPDCVDLAGRMDRWGKLGCLRRLGQIVEEILPRGLAWVEEKRPFLHRLLSVSRLETAALRFAIRRKVLRAIRKTPAQSPRSRTRPVRARRARRFARLPTDPILRPTKPLWRTDPAYRELGRSLLCRTEILVKSFLRHGALLHLVQSVRRYYPELPVRIVDDSIRGGERNEIIEQIRAIRGVSWHQMPFDSGLPAGRNLAVLSSSAEFVILCDDDMLFTPETDLTALLIGLHETGVDIFGGLSRRKGKVASNWCGNLVIDGATLRMTPLSRTVETVAGIRYRRTDVTYNFFAARRAFLMTLPWDPRWKIGGEHLDSALTWQRAGASIAFTPDCICDETGIANSREYATYRNRNFGQSELDEKWGIRTRRTIGVTRFPGI